MTILTLGINHKTATVTLREKVAFSPEKRQLALQQLQNNGLADNAVILSTCNRTEIYLHNKRIPPQESEIWVQHCLYWFALIHQIEFEQLKKHAYLYENQEAVQHLMRVACGLDSLILGEPQILGQVKQAYQDSELFYQENQMAMSSELSRLFQKTFSTAKRVRTETEIGGSAVSVAYAACSLARQIFDSFGKLHILLVGAGETIELVSRHLLQHGAKNLMIANRTLARAEALVEKLSNPHIQVLSLNALQIRLNQADIVISSTGSDHVLITKDMVKIAQKQRRNQPMLIVDIAVPRDVDSSVGELASVYHYSVDDLQHIIQRNLELRKEASAKAEYIIQEECQTFFGWLKVHQFSGLIRNYRDNAEQTRQALLDKALQSLQQGQNAEVILQELSYKLTNKLLHAPTQAMQTMVKKGNAQGLQTFSAVLGIEPKEPIE
ncbi:glutamyl-tRNA reductase [Conservatibacter flavescens]|uniref:Glutamyl-tRNA reductase n=1 Tax=Conservatibacter flavescens TaxID=28161 RepID=A0A2M8S5P4_9PAST|nr:glutamyl-tRNA reductase [Conservatibacter flavescens]PJG86444.1 glutamyl-tRNA reductase [Conservatibacter flavescens]